MSFSEHIVRQAWIRSGGKCECTGRTHSHIGRCSKTLLEVYRGDLEVKAGWEAHSKSGSYKDLEDCEILCNDCQEGIHYL